MAEKNKEDLCGNCGCKLGTKYLIRVNKGPNRKAKWFFEATSKKSIVGWMKFIVDEHAFKEIQIFNLLTECPIHQKFWSSKTDKENLNPLIKDLSI